MKTTRTLAAILTVLALTGACTRSVGHDDSAPPTGKKAAPGGRTVAIDVELISALQTFGECDDLLSYLRTEGAKAVGPYGFDRGAMYRGGVVTLDAAAATTTAGPPSAGAGAAR